MSLEEEDTIRILKTTLQTLTRLQDSVKELYERVDALEGILSASSTSTTVQQTVQRNTKPAWPDSERSFPTTQKSALTSSVNSANSSKKVVIFVVDSNLPNGMSDYIARFILFFEGNSYEVKAAAMLSQVQQKISDAGRRFAGVVMCHKVSSDWYSDFTDNKKEIYTYMRDNHPSKVALVLLYSNQRGNQRSRLFPPGFSFPAIQMDFSGSDNDMRFREDDFGKSFDELERGPIKAWK